MTKLQPGDVVTHPAGTARAYRLGWAPAHPVFVCSAKPSHLGHTLVASLVGDALELKGGVAGAHYEVRLGGKAVAVHVVHQAKATLKASTGPLPAGAELLEVPPVDIYLEVP